MKTINNYRKIYIDNKEVGKIQLVGGEIPQLEYDLDPEYWGQGIMTKELTKYLKNMKPIKLMAIVEITNLRSQRVLDKVGFLKMTEFKDYCIFVNDLGANKERKEIMKDLINQGFVEKCKKEIK